MKITWISPTSPFNPSYLRRIYVIGLFLLIVFLGPLSFTDNALWLKIVFVLSVITSYFGLFTRVSMLVLIFSSIALFKLPPFANTLLDYYLDIGLILMASRCSDVLSVDGMFQARYRAMKKEIAPPGPSAVYAVPIRLIWIIGALGLFLSGAGAHPVVLTIFVVIYLISWINLMRRVHQMGKVLIPTPLYVLYDGGCLLCRSTAAFLNTVDEFGKLTFIDATDRSALKEAGFGHLNDEELMKDIHIIENGKIYLGFEGYRRIARRIPVLLPLSPLMYVPPIPAMAHAIYRKIAESRRCAMKNAKPSEPWKGIESPRTPLDVIMPVAVCVLLIIGHLFNL